MSNEFDSAPLEGIRVLDMTRFVAGPYCTMLLADAGADVIKIEPLEGEETRHLDPILQAKDGQTISGYFLRFNRNKRSVSVDLRSEGGREVFADLVRSADVVVENFRPGVLVQLGFSYERMAELNAGIVYCSISGFGHSEGPNSEHPAFAILAEVLAGLLTYNPHPGEPPIWTGLGLGDLFPASLSVSGICMALVRRARTGRGGHVDMAMYDGIISLNERAIGMTAMTGKEIEIGQPAFIAPFGLFEAKDGWLCIAVIGEKVWQGFCRAIERPDLLEDPLMKTGQSRAEHLPDILGPAIREWLNTRTREEATSRLLAEGVPAGPVRKASEVVNDPQALARNMIYRYGSYAGYEATVSGNPIRVTPRQQQELRPAPALGEHTEEVLGEVAGYSVERIAELEGKGAIRRWQQ